MGAHRTAGVTLQELVLGLGIVSLTLGLGVPLLADLILDARRLSRVNGLVRAIQLARVEAFKTGHHAVVCPSPDGADCGGAEDWQHGWLVFLNRDRDRPPRVDADEPLIWHQALAPGRGSVSANRRAFSFRPVGVRSTNGTVVFCDRRGSPAARAVIVSYTGRPRTSGRRADGEALDC